MKKLFSFVMAAFIGLTAFAAEEKSSCPAGTLVDGKVIHELECCTIVQEQGESTTALKSVSPWQAPAKSIMTITPKEGVTIEEFVVNTKNTTLATYIGKSELTNATKTVTNNTLVTFEVTNGTEPVVMKFVSTTIKFAELTITYTQEGGSVTPEPEDTTVVTPEPEPTVVYTVAGAPAALFGTEWDATNKANNMTLQADGTYKWEKADVELEAKKVEFKVVKDGNWNTSYPTAAGVNAEYTIAQKGKYDVTITFNPTTTDLAMNAVLDGDIVTPEPEDTTVVTPPTPAEIYTVAGSPASLFGTEWDPANKANIMTMQADGTYKWEKTNMELSAITIQFKVVKGNKWGTEYPSSNYELKIAKSGKYTVTITFNPNGNKVNATATLQEEVEVIPTVVIAGDMNEWNTTANTFTMAADKQTATLALNLEAKDYGFKMIIAGSWLSDAKTITRDNNTTIFSGANLNDNSTLKADVAGEYAFTWTYKTNTLTVTYPEAGDDPVDPNPGDDPVVEPDGDVWTVLGVDALGLNWTIEATDNDMVKQEDGSYKLVKENLELGAGNYDYKVAKNHSWDVSIPAGQPNQTLTIETSGVYNVTFVLDAACTTLTATAELVQAGEVIPVVGMHGNFLGSWADTEKFTMAEDKKTASLVLTIPVGEYEFGMQIAGVWTANGTAFTRENTSAAIVGTSPNNTLSADVEGEYTFTWIYETSTLTIAYPVAGDDPVDPETAVDNVAVGEKAVKVIHNGQMYIIRNGVIYNAMGQIAE